MQEEGHKRTLGEILDQVEQDQTLLGGSSAEQESRAENTEAGEGSILGGLLGNPELLSKLPVLLQVVGALKDDGLGGEVRRPDTPEALLCALRPYVSEGRRQALDAMIRVSRVSASLKSLK